ncbi:MAG: hypothetical protein L0215_17340 [Gemmataceae bacterium]|nr:hypothetical protein [Gemmataceae bacterium]
MQQTAIAQSRRLLKMLTRRHLGVRRLVAALGFLEDSMLPLSWRIK